LAEIDRRGSATNVAYLLPQGTIRMNVIGTASRAATSAELQAMREQVDQGMREGAFGMSSGLTYVPGMFADTEELVALCEVVTAHGGYYSPHQRSYGAGALEAYREVLEIGERSGCPVHLTHATMNFPENRGRAAGAGRPGPRTWGARHPGLLPVPARLHDPGGAAAELGYHRRPRGHPGDAGRTRPTRPDRSGDGGRGQRRAPWGPDRLEHRGDRRSARSRARRPGGPHHRPARPDRAAGPG